VANFSTSFACVVDTGGKYATGVNDTSGKLGAWGKLIHERTRSQKSRDTVPLKALTYEKRGSHKSVQVPIL
jgi:hypothetical protein